MAAAANSGWPKAGNPVSEDRERLYEEPVRWDPCGLGTRVAGKPSMGSTADEWGTGAEPRNCVA